MISNIIIKHVIIQFNIQPVTDSTFIGSTEYICANCIGQSTLTILYRLKSTVPAEKF
jgi:hypothetical protein